VRVYANKRTKSMKFSGVLLELAHFFCARDARVIALVELVGN
jgi:hypothetical protein